MMSLSVDSDDRSGGLLASRYRLEQKLGSGGMGHVYRATNELIGRAVAIKLLRPEHAKNTEVVERFLREARAANLVRHPNVVDVLDIGQDDDGSPFIVQELLQGEDLAAYVRRKGGRISPAEVVEFLCPIIDAIAEAHLRGVVHRDIKPENVFLANQGDKRIPKLLDFGISQIKMHGIRTTQAGVIMGTPAYMPPEQIQGVRDTDARSDVWAIGVMLFEVLSGRLPFEGEDAMQIFLAVATKDAPRLKDVVSQVPLEFSSTIERCLKRDPKERYPNASDIAVALRAIALRHPSRELAIPIVAKNAPTISASPAAMPDIPDLVVPPPVVSKPVASQRSVRPKIALAEEPAPRASQPVLALSGMMIGPSSTSTGRRPSTYEPHDASPSEPQDDGVIVSLAAVGVITVVGLAVLTLFARSASGWHVLEIASVAASPEVVTGTQVGLGLGAVVLGVVWVRGAHKIWTSEMGGKTVTAGLIAFLAALAFFAAVELFRAVG